MNEEKKELQDMTLKEFIDDNHKLISTFAILATLSAFANNLPDKESGGILAFLLFALTLIVGGEIVESFPYRSRGNLSWFGMVFSLSVLIFALMWVRRYFPVLLVLFIWGLALIVTILIFAGLAEGIWQIVRRVPWLRGRRQRVRDRLIPRLGAMLLIASAALALRHFLHK